MNMVSELSRILSERTCIVGMGNYYRNDDAAGLYVIDALKDAVTRPCLEVLNVEDVLESYVFYIANKTLDNVLIIDAVRADCDPGSVVFGNVMDLEDITRNISSHKISLDLACQIFSNSGKNTYLLGIAVQNTEFGNTISEEVSLSADSVLNLIISLSGETPVCGNDESGDSSCENLIAERSAI